MTLFKDRKRLRLTGLVLLVAGAVGYLALRSLFMDHWIAMTMYGALSVVSVGVYVAVGVVGLGLILLVASFIRRDRRPLG